jgi:APA family basic amino acid/polyamine antiporter
MASQPTDKATGQIGFWTTVALVMGNMIGSGIFLLPSSLAAYRGLGLAGWLCSTAGALLLAFVFARLARIEPKAGGPYAYTRHGFGDLAGFLVGWGYWISVSTANAAIAVAFVGYLDPFLPALVRHPASAAVTAIAAVWTLIAVNIVGVRAAGRLQVVTVVLKALPLAAVGVLGLTAIDLSHFTTTETTAGGIVSAVTATTTLTLWAFLGLESGTVPASHVENADRTIPRATIVGTLLTACIYILGTVGVMAVLPPEALGKSTAPFADAARVLGGEWAAAAVALGAAISCFGALNGWTLIAGQLPLAVARDGLFPRVFARVSRTGTPVAGMVITGLVASAFVAMNYTRGLVDLFTFAILLATLHTLIPYVFCSLATFLVVERGRSATWPPFGAGLIAAAAFVFSVWAIAGAGAETVYWGFLLLLAGLPVYVVVSRAWRR